MAKEAHGRSPGERGRKLPDIAVHQHEFNPTCSSAAALFPGCGKRRKGPVDCQQLPPSRSLRTFGEAASMERQILSRPASTRERRGCRQGAGRLTGIRSSRSPHRPPGPGDELFQPRLRSGSPTPSGPALRDGKGRSSVRKGPAPSPLGHPQPRSV